MLGAEQKSIHYSCGLVWFGSVAEMQTANQTARFNAKVIRIKCSFLRFRFGLGWFAIFLLGWFGFEHPYFLPRHINLWINRSTKVKLKENQSSVMIFFFF